jgi:hypothetical protein
MVLAQRRYASVFAGARPFRPDCPPGIKAYAEALVTSPEVLEKLTRRRFVAGYERQEGQGD